ncbi:hypothetical protein [Pseudonocardia sp. H11422]|nr:hypothetical protein [Pseudonocardia sp. H11422]
MSVGGQVAALRPGVGADGGPDVEGVRDALDGLLDAVTDSSVHT